MTTTDILSRLENVMGGGNQYSARCPAHGDKHNSLSVSIGNDGRTLFNCHAGCTAEAVAQSLGLTIQDLFPDSKQSPARAIQEAIYHYNKQALRKIKMRESDGGKYFFWQHLENGEWKKGRNGIVPMLYSTVEQLQEAVYLVEGEKDVEAFQRLGVDAVSPPDGAKSKWLPEYSEVLKDRTVAIIPDNDGPGMELAQKEAAALHGIAKSVQILDLTRIWSELPEHGDTTDLINHMGDEDGLVAIMKLVPNTPEWEPGEYKEPEDPFFSCFKTLDTFEEEEATWLIPGWLPEAQITLMAADGGVGKTTSWAEILAALSSGRACFLDPPGHNRKPVKVAFVTTEDSIRKKLRKKLREAGANLENIVTMDLLSDKDGMLRNFKFGSSDMTRFIRHHRPALCVFDPVQGFIPPDINMGSRNAMRDCMAPLISLGEECGTTFLVVCHTNKRGNASGRNRVADSADLWDISRSVLMAGYTEDNGVRYLSNEKNNYTTLQETVLFSINNDGRIQHEGTSWKRDREYMADSITAKSAPKREGCKEFILAALDEAGGAMPSEDLTGIAQRGGYATETIKRAKSELKKSGEVKYFSTGGNKEKVWHIQKVGFGDFVESEESTPWDSTDQMPLTV